MANNLDAFIPEIWSTRIIQNIDQLNVAMMLAANTDYEGEIRQAGDTVQVRTFGDVTVQDYQRGMTISYEDLSPTRETLTVDTSKYFAFNVDDLDRAQNDIGALDGYTRRAAVSLAEHIDSYIFSFHSSANTNNVLTSSGSAYDISTSTVYPLIVSAGLALDRQDVEQSGRWMVVTPYFKSLLLQDTTYFIKGSTLGDTVLTTGRFGATAQQMTAQGFIGQIGNFDVYVSNNLPKSGSNFRCVFGQGKPVSYAAQIPPGTLEALRLETTFATAIRGLLLHGGKVFSEHAKKLGTILVDNS